MNGNFMKMTNRGFAPCKRSLLFACLFLFCSLSALPNENYNSATSFSNRYSDYDYYGERSPYSFWSNWFIGASGGVQTFFADHAKQGYKNGNFFKTNLSWGAEAYLGKWWSPYIGTRAGYSIQALKGLVQSEFYGMGSRSLYYFSPQEQQRAIDQGALPPIPNIGISFEAGKHDGAPFSTGKMFEPWDLGENRGFWLYEQRLDVHSVFGDCLFNVTNLLLGVNEKRFWSVSPYVGLGWMRVVTPTPIDPSTPGKRMKAPKEVSANIGILNSFRLANMVDLVLDVRGSMVNERIKIQTGGRRQDGILSASLGLVVHLGKRDWTTPVTGMSDTELATLNDRISEVNRENVALRKSLNDCMNGTTIVTGAPGTPGVTNFGSAERMIEWRNVATDVYIRFQINETNLLREARVQLGFLARLMREYPEGNYMITGYADASTGTPDLNIRLSRARAESVKNCLVREFGIDASRLSTAFEGGIENRYYNDPYLSRAVIIRPVK